MGRKSDRKPVDDDSDRKRKRKERGPGVAELMAAVQGCPPSTRLHFEWVVGNGIGEHAVREAQQAHGRAMVARVERAERAARAPADDCPKGCKAEPLVIGPLHGRQRWQIDVAADPPRACTWSWVGYIGLCDCTPDLDW